MDHDVMSELAGRVWDDDPLQTLTATAALRGELARMEAGAVRRARVTGLSWAQIALALGVSRQAAHRKYGGSRFTRG